MTRHQRPPVPRAPRPHADYQDPTGDVIVLHVPDVQDCQTRVLDAKGRVWRRRIGFATAGQEPR